MKKIVALVLCLALALSLCTVAFAATAYNVAAGELNGKVNTSTKWETDVDVVGVADNKTVNVYDLLDMSNKSEKVENVVITDATDAVYALTEDTKVTYFKRGSNSYETTGTKVATVSESVGEDDLACGAVFFNTNAASSADVTADTLYKGADGKYYSRSASTAEQAAGTKEVLVDGKLLSLYEVTLNEEIADDYTDGAAQWYEIVHTLDVTFDDKTAKVTKVECAECDVVLNFKTDETDAINAYGTGNYTAVKDADFTNDKFDGFTGTIYYKSGSTTTSAGSSSETVESAKTFDAGIALYAGMALASVAGSAVVIGKKKEF